MRRGEPSPAGSILPSIMPLKAESSSDVDAIVDEDNVQARDLEKQVNAILANLNLDIGRRYHEADFVNLIRSGKIDEYRRVCQTYVKEFPSFRKEGTCLLLMGTPGTGKTHLVVSTAKGIARQGYRVKYTTPLRMARRIRETWGKGERSEAEAIKEFLDYDALFIDEVGAQFGSPTEVVTLMEVIDRRYAEMRPTILGTNLTEEQLIALLSAPAVDRFHEGRGSVLIFDWESWRRR